ncbi:dephospho-CoA kinase [Ramlibacter sp. AN1015]|uniref:dephospho-CoA kinase n=1 Tax=Ramlibacter sp. AN1015 TaxID=3133428 RepID=UPI0030BD94A5
MLRLGLTGGIGSGKSTVLAMLEQLGAFPIDADAISRETTAPGGPAIEPIRQQFGAEFVGPDGGLDRALMREHAYAHPGARRRLEAIVHPLVAAGIQRRVDTALAEGRRCAVFDIPLLVESGRWRRALDRVLVIDCSAHTQIERVKARSNLSEAQVEAVIAAQAPRGLRLAAADLVICNEGHGLAQLQAHVHEAAKAFGL